MHPRGTMMIRRVPSDNDRSTTKRGRVLSIHQVGVQVRDPRVRIHAQRRIPGLTKAESPGPPPVFLPTTPAPAAAAVSPLHAGLTAGSRGVLPVHALAVRADPEEPDSIRSVLDAELRVAGDASFERRLCVDGVLLAEVEDPADPGSGQGDRRPAADAPAMPPIAAPFKTRSTTPFRRSASRQ